FVSFVLFFFFFFFQAEDGIRDLYVTGVQTCALPISDAPTSCVRRRRQAGSIASISPRASRSGPRRSARPTGTPAELRSWSTASRSEERRVGKECRSRWSSYG